MVRLTMPPPDLSPMCCYRCGPFPPPAQRRRHHAGTIECQDAPVTVTFEAPIEAHDQKAGGAA